MIIHSLTFAAKCSRIYESTAIIYVSPDVDANPKETGKASFCIVG
jgi:hypothetical protein